MSINGPTAINEAEGTVTWANMADDDVDLHPPPVMCKIPGCERTALPGSGRYAKLCVAHKAAKQAQRKPPAPLGTGATAAAPTPEPIDQLIAQLEQQAALYTRQLEIARRMREDLTATRERGA